MAKGYGPDTTLLDISAKMYASESEFVDYSKVIIPLIDEYTKRVKENEAALKKAILELPHIDFSLVDVQLQDKLKTASISMKKSFAEAARKYNNTSTSDPNLHVYTQEMQAAQNGLVLIKEDLEAFLLLRENGREGILNNLDISDWNDIVSRDALTNLLSGKGEDGSDYLKDNIEFDEKGAWFVDPTRGNDDPKKRIRLSEMAHNKFVTGEGDAKFTAIQNTVMETAQQGAEWSALELIVGQGVNQALRELGNEGSGMSAFDSEFFGGVKFIDKWMRDNGITDPNAIAVEKERLRTGDLGTVTGKGGITFRKAFEDYVMQHYKTIHGKFYQSTKKTSKPTAYNVIAKGEIPVVDQLSQLKKINAKLEGQIIPSFDGTGGYFVWDPNGKTKKEKKNTTAAEGYKWVNPGDDETQWKSLEFVKNREVSNEQIRGFTGNDAAALRALIKDLNK